MWEFRVPIDLVEAEAPLEARFVYIYLLSRAEPRTKTLRSNNTALAGSLHIHRATMRKLVASLVRTGWVEVKPVEAHETVYVLRNPILEERQRELQRVQARLRHADYKGEAIMHELLSLKVASTKYSINVRLGFMKNPTTDGPLELDRYYFEHKVAFEFNGPQHYGPTEAFPDPEQARQTIARDYIKKAICQEHGIHLIIITAEDLTSERIERKIGGHLPLRDVRSDDPVLQYLNAMGKQYMRQAAKGSGPR